MYNEKLKVLCLELGVKYVDIWDEIMDGDMLNQNYKGHSVGGVNKYDVHLNPDLVSVIWENKLNRI